MVGRHVADCPLVTAPKVPGLSCGDTLQHRPCRALPALAVGMHTLSINREGPYRGAVMLGVYRLSMLDWATAVGWRICKGGSRCCGSRNAGAAEAGLRSLAPCALLGLRTGGRPQRNPLGQVPSGPLLLHAVYALEQRQLSLARREDGGLPRKRDVHRLLFRLRVRPAFRPV